MITTLAVKFITFLNKFITSDFATNIDKLQKENINPYIQHSLLHDIAFTIVLVKAYIILMEYAKTKHINLKYILEIAIISPIVEIVFNYSSYKFEMIILFWILAIIFSIVYLFFYEKLQKVEEDYIENHK